MFYRNLLASDIVNMVVATIWTPTWQPFKSTTEDSYFCYKKFKKIFNCTFTINTLIWYYFYSITKFNLMNDFNYRFDFDIGLDVSNKKSNMLVVILGYYDGEIYIKTVYPMPKHNIR